MTMANSNLKTLNVVMESFRRQPPAETTRTAKATFQQLPVSVKM